MTRATWTETAQADLAGLDTKYFESSVDYTDRVGRAALAAGRFIADHPMAGPMLVSGIRKWTVRGTDYILIHRPAPGGVEVLRFRDARSDWQAISG